MRRFTAKGNKMLSKREKLQRGLARDFAKQSGIKVS